MLDVIILSPTRSLAPRVASKLGCGLLSTQIPGIKQKTVAQQKNTQETNSEEELKAKVETEVEWE